MRFDNISMNGPLLGNSATIASASTTDLSTVAGNAVSVSGTTTIDSFGTVQAGAVFNLTFQDVLVLTYNAGSMILPGNASITTAAGDVAVLESLGSGNWKCTGYLRQGVPPMAGGYNAVTKSQFDALVAASGLAPGEWYYVQAAYPSPLFAADWDLLVLANTTSSIDAFFVFANIGGSTISAVSDSPTLATGFTLTLYGQNQSTLMSYSQAASYAPATFAIGLSVIINGASGSFQTTISSDGAAVENKNVRNIETGITGDFDPAFTTFYLYSGQYAPTVTPTGFDATTNVKSSYLVQGNILHTMHTIDVDNTSAATSGRIKITVPDGFPIDTVSADTVVGTYSLKEAKFYADIDSLTIGQASGEIDVLFVFTTAPTTFQISLSCQSKLA